MSTEDRIRRQLEIQAWLYNYSSAQFYVLWGVAQKGKVYKQVWNGTEWNRTGICVFAPSATLHMYFYMTFAYGTVLHTKLCMLHTKFHVAVSGS